MLGCHTESVPGTSHYRPERTLVSTPELIDVDSDVVDAPDRQLEADQDATDRHLAHSDTAAWNGLNEHAAVGVSTTTTEDFDPESEVEVDLSNPFLPGLPNETLIAGIGQAPIM